MSDNLDALKTCPVGTRIWFQREKRPYRVRARSFRHLVCTKPFNPRRTVLYTIVDLAEGIRGPENLVFGMGAETDEDCKAMLERLNDPSDPSEVSRRRCIPLDFLRLELP